MIRMKNEARATSKLTHQTELKQSKKKTIIDSRAIESCSSFMRRSQTFSLVEAAIPHNEE
jgi:hypothetical protein